MVGPNLTLAEMASPGGQEALLESSFRRLLSAIESEKARVRAEAKRIETERTETTSVLEELKRSTDEWCTNKEVEIRQSWSKLDETAEVMKKLIPHKSNLVDLRCGDDTYTLPRTLLDFEEAYLGKLVDRGLQGELPRDAQGRLVLDFDPPCFRILIEFLQSRRLEPKCPTPTIPPELWRNMEVQLDALNVKAFSRENRLSRFTHTSLKVTVNTVESTYDGWQVVTGEDPLSTSKDAYFEVTVEKNTDPKGGLAIGILGHVPTGDEVHGVHFEDGVLYNSNNGLLGAGVGVEDVTANVTFEEGSVIGLRWQTAGQLTWYKNGKSIGTCVLRPGMSDLVYPALAIYPKQTRLRVDFGARRKDLPPPAHA
jgi:hypothetical protein